MLPIITGIGLGLAESTRLSFVDRAIDSRKFLIGANLITYFTCAVFGSLIIIFRDYIIKGAAAFGTLIADGARLCVEVFKRIITFLSGLFNMRNSEIFEQVGREQSEGRADFNGWILLGAGIILVSALIVGAVALIIKIRKQKVSDEELTVLYIKKKRWKEDKIKKREVKEINRRGRAFNIKYFFMRANNPEIFMYKMKRVLRKTDYKMLSSESPRQVFNKFLKTELISDELKKSMNNMADIVDRYYYAEEKGDLYKREEGEILLSKIRKESRRKR